MSEMKAEFKFEIGDIVVLTTEQAAVAAATLLSKDCGIVHPRQIAERRFQECHGGVSQTHYLLVGAQGVLVPELGLVSWDDYLAELDKNRCMTLDQLASMNAKINGLAAAVRDLQEKLPPTPIGG